MSELWKYKEIYSNPNTGYGKTNHGKDAYALLPAIPVSLVDIGCGDNSFIKNGSFKDSELIGVDFAHPKADVTAEAKDLPFCDKSFVWITSFDVLEHIIEEDIDETLKEFSRVAQCFCFSIAYRDSSTRASDGSTFHPTVKPESWWIDKISKYGTVTKIKQYLVGVFINKQ